MIELLALLAAALGLAFGVSRADAKRAKARASAAEARAATAEKQAETMAQMELARSRARQAGQEELAKMRAALNKNGRRDQLSQP